REPGNASLSVFPCPYLDRPNQRVKYFTDGPSAVCYIRLRRNTFFILAGCDMRRREFVGLIGGAAAALSMSRPAREQQLPVIGYLGTSAPESSAPFTAAFRKGLGEGGFTESRNVMIEYRWGFNNVERLPELAADLVRRRVKLIYATPALSALAAKAATSTIP